MGGKGTASGVTRERKSSTKMVMLCFVWDLWSSSAPLLRHLKQLKVAYSPPGDFNLRDFHLAVKNLPSDAFSPEFNISGALCCSDLKYSSVLNDQVLYSCGEHYNGVTRKVVLISSFIFENMDCAIKKVFMDAADNCVYVEFVFLEQKSSHLASVPKNINNFLKKIGDLENCSFPNCVPDALLAW